MTITLVPGSAYRLTSNFKVGHCEFHRGEVVTYSSGGYSPYDDCYVYHFVVSTGENRMCASQAELTDAELTNFEPTEF